MGVVIFTPDCVHLNHRIIYIPSRGVTSPGSCSGPILRQLQAVGTCAWYRADNDELSKEETKGVLSLPETYIEIAVEIFHRRDKRANLTSNELADVEHDI